MCKGVFISLGWGPKNATSGPHGEHMFSSVNSCPRPSQSGCITLCSHQSCVNDLVSSHPHQQLVLSLFFVLAVLISVWSPNSLWSQSTSFWLMALSIFLCICHLCALHCKMSVHAFLGCLSCYWCVLRVPSLIFDASPLSDMWFAKLSSQSIACLFQFLNRVFRKAKVLLFDEV